MRWMWLLMSALSLVAGVLAHGPETTMPFYRPTTCGDNTNVRFYVEPITPTTQTPLTVGFRGDSGDSCVPAYARHEVRPGAIDIYSTEPCDVACAAIITPWEVGATVGPLAPGAYTVRLFINTTASYTATLTVAGTPSTPTPTTTPTPPPPTATPTPTATATALPTATPYVCDPADRAAVCNGVIVTRVYLDLRCDGFFNRGVDWPLAGVTLTLNLPDGSSRQVETGPEGEVAIRGATVLPGQSLTLTAPAHPPAPAWVDQAGLSLAPCGLSTVTLSRANFGLFGTSYVDIRYGLQR